MKFSELKKKRWFRILGSTYILIIVLFIVWMIFFDTNSYFIHKELNDEIEALEENKEFYQKEIGKDKEFLDKMKDSNEIEKFAREKYFLKKEGEDIFIIEHEDSLK
ncbi:MAG TPA: septum formation initiator family protein [Flavobacteriaceae bacterium]|mgnify:CR=1 FL=1|jgi:cell division protein FtsB|nr:septum formation initiator [Flavobacteriaceae bacterium]HBR54659.1 septum formation initiator [Flavobacteriaceae bacterium]HIB48488.1 septum formation initiator family protein [Flavobacteriaceae bacterium]HIN99996.1 septum formation initiator family protein [Flavobacteriaceae bacterium]|tara:strand:- start:1912 stop:2229 length:318 start_codon:yes stop_codon:yes gene_type:complete